MFNSWKLKIVTSFVIHFPIILIQKHETERFDSKPDLHKIISWWHDKTKSAVICNLQGFVVFIYLFIYSFTYLYIYLFNYLSIYIYLFFYLYILIDWLIDWLIDFLFVLLLLFFQFCFCFSIEGCDSVRCFISFVSCDVTKTRSTPGVLKLFFDSVRPEVYHPNPYRSLRIFLPQNWLIWHHKLEHQSQVFP